MNMEQRIANFNSGPRSERDYLGMLVNLFEKDGWQVTSELIVGDKVADLVISSGSLRYIVELKVSSEGRRDRLVPLLSQAILQARAIAQAWPDPAEPLPVVAAPVISRSTVDGLMGFLAEVAPGAAVGIFDHEGFRHFVGPGLEKLNAAPPRPARRQKLPTQGSGYLFSDLNQWMLKVLLAPLIPEELLRAPRREYRNATELAVAAKVSVMSAFRFVRQLRQEGFLDNDSESLCLVRREELMHSWQVAHMRSLPEMPLRWIATFKNGRQLPVALQAHHANPGVKERPLRACLGLFEAAESLGYGNVSGVPAHFYLEYLDRAVFDRLGLSPEGAEYRPDVYVRVPAFRESIFRAAVDRDGLQVADIIQVWLDVSSQTAQGDALAKEIWRRDLAPIFNEES